MKPGTPEMRNKDSDSSNNQIQEYHQKKQRERQEKLNKNREDFLQDFESLETQFNILLSENISNSNDLSELLVRLDDSIIKILDLLKTTNDLEIDLDEDIKNLISCASKCQNALTNVQMLNADVFAEYTNQLKQALAVFKNNFVQICGFSNNNNNNNNEANYSPANNSTTDLQPLPFMETQSNNQEDQSDMLPNETWIKILGYLNRKELTQIAQVSKRFNYLADDPDLFEKTIHHPSFADIRCFRVSDDGNFFVCNTRKKILLGNLKRGLLITQLSKNDDQYSYCTLSKDNQYIASYVYNYEHKRVKDYIQILKIASKSIVKEFCVTSIRLRLIEKHECSGAAISNITFMSDDKLCLIMELIKIGGSHAGSYVIEYDIKSGEEKVVLLQNLTEVEQQALIVKSSAYFRENGIRDISCEHKINLNNSETVIAEDIHFFKDKKIMLCAMKRGLQEKKIVILDLENHSIERIISVNPLGGKAQFSSISLSPDERYVAVCGGQNILEVSIKTTNYFINIYDLNNKNECIKTLNIDGAQCVYFTENGLFVVGLKGINFYNFAELGCIKNNNDKQIEKGNKPSNLQTENECSEFDLQLKEIKKELHGLLSHEYFEKNLYENEYIEKLKLLKNALSKLYETATKLNLPNCYLLNNCVEKLIELIANSKDLIVHCYTEYVTPAKKYFSQFENLFFLVMNDKGDKQQSDATKSNQNQVNEGKHEIESDEEFTHLNSLSR